MSFWVVTYHIDFHMDDGTLVTRKDMRTTEDPDLDTEDKVEEWLLNRYNNSDDPLVDMNNLFVGVKSEKLVIDEIILNNDPFKN